METLISPKGSMQNVMIIKLSSTKWFSKIDDADAWALLYGGTNQFKETQQENMILEVPSCSASEQTSSSPHS